MRYIFVDEAGTSQFEPVTVVVGLIADADSHVLSAERFITETLNSVPSEFQKDFVFHATSVFGNKKYQDRWSMTDRLHLLCQMMSVPRRIGMAITLSASWRNAVNLQDVAASLSISQCQYEHFLTFADCLCVADRNIRRYAGPTEVASVVAEDVPEMRRFLKRVPRLAKAQGFHIAPRQLRNIPDDQEAGYNTQSGELRIARIRDSIHFVDKADDLLVQVADACAYGFRRYFAGETFGVNFVRAILGSEEKLRNFGSPAGTECWWPTSSNTPR